MTRRYRYPKPGRPQHTASDTLHAVARMLTTPRPGGIGLAVPEEIRNLRRATPTQPARLLLPSQAGVHHLRRWADALDRIDSITATASALGNGDLALVVVGRIPRGPVVSIESWVLDFPMDLIRDEDRAMSLDELRALDRSQ
jgi:hypothetical protein